MVYTAEEKKQIDDLSTKIQGLIDHPDQKLRRDDLLPFAHSNVLEVQGSLAFLILRRDLAMRIVPGLTLDEEQSVLFRYWHQSLLENPADSDLVGGRYASAGEILSRFNSLWKDPTPNQEILSAMKNWIAEMYRSGNEEVRTCIVQGILEHLLQDTQLRRFFRDWKSDSVLADAYKDATD